MTMTQNKLRSHNICMTELPRYVHAQAKFEIQNLNIRKAKFEIQNLNIRTEG